MTLNKNILDIYSDYLLTSFDLATSTGLSTSLNGQLSHDKISRFLGGVYQEEGQLKHTEYTSKGLWSLVKETLRQDEFDQGILVIDDTVEEKQYTDESEVNCWHFDHTTGKNIKGVNMINFLYLGQELVTPLAFEIIKKTEIFTDKDGKQKRRSTITQNQLVRENINQIAKNHVKFKYVLMDSWFACNETLELIQQHKKYFVVPLKSNRKLTLSKTEKIKGKWLKLDNESLNQRLDNTPTATEIWLEGLPFPVYLTKQVFTNEDGSVTTMYLITNDKDLFNKPNQIQQIYQKRWKIEEFYKSLKSNLAFSKSPTKNAFT